MDETPLPWANAAERWPDAIALVDGDERWTYRELAFRIARRAEQLADESLGAGDRIAFFPDRDVTTVELLAAILSLGAIACPINPKFPPERQLSIVSRLGAKILPPRCVTPLETAAGSSSSPLAVAALQRRFSRGEPATMVLSSGSTGQPKAVVHDLVAHVQNALGSAANIPLTVGDRWLWSLPAFHVSGLSILIRCAVTGATVVCDRSRNLDREMLETERITHVSMVPTQLYRWLESLNDQTVSTTWELKAILLGGSAASRSLVEMANRYDCPLFVTYGLTEMASQVTTTSATDPSDRWLTCGRVLPGRELRLSESGEILVRGQTFCLGYLRSADDEGSSIAGNRDGSLMLRSIVDPEGWFHTRDLGRLDEQGYLTVLGRSDNMFVSAGENLHAEAIEATLLSHPAIYEAVVVPVSDVEYGARPIAFVAADEWHEADWRDHVRQLASGLEVPVRFYPLPPLTMGLKRDRNQLQRQAEVAFRRS